MAHRGICCHLSLLALEMGLTNSATGYQPCLNFSLLRTMYVSDPPLFPRPCVVTCAIHFSSFFFFFLVIILYRDCIYYMYRALREVIIGGGGGYNSKRQSLATLRSLADEVGQGRTGARGSLYTDQ
jgi:hypothetical protein